MKRISGSYLIIISAVVAVLFWSLKPIFITLMGVDVGFVEVYILSVGIAVLVSTFIAIMMPKETKRVVTSRVSLKGVKYSIVSGLFLAMWYYGFYRALFEAPKTEATVIAFVWPLIAFISLRIFSPKTAPALRLVQWVFVIFAFIGTAIVVGGSALNSVTFNYGLIWAVIAAIGSGMYLPFTLKALDAFQEIIPSAPKSTFYAITVANTVALFTVLISVFISGHKFDFSNLSLKVLILCGLIGIGTYLFAEIAWSWAFREYSSLTLSALPYFSPAVSVILLGVLFGEKVTTWTIVGMLMILTSNISLTFTKTRVSVLDEGMTEPENKSIVLDIGK